MENTVPPTPPMRQCVTCNEWKPLTVEYFYRCKDLRDGFHYHCKRCQRTPLPGTVKQRGNKAGSHRPVTRTADGLTKICTKCATEKPLDQFGPYKAGTYGVRAVCNECRKAESAEYYARRYGLKREPLPHPVNGGKACRRCKIEKPLEAFSPDKRASDGRGSQCRQCVREVQLPYRERNAARARQKWEENGDLYRARGRQWKRDNPLKVRQLNAKREAIKKAAQVEGNIDYDLILERDGDYCYICNGTIWPGQRIAFDHVIPLVPRKGTNRQPGPHTEANIKVTHYLCNARKGQKLLEEMTSYDRRGVKPPRYVQLPLIREGE